MMKEEFERIVGYKVSLEDYNNIIEPMYMSTDIDKYDFVKLLNRERFEVKEELSDESKKIIEDAKAEIKELKADIKELKDDIDRYNQYITESKDSLYKTDDDRKYWRRAIKTKKEFIKNYKARIKALEFVIA